jgi:hypothetical protein
MPCQGSEPGIFILASDTFPNIAGTISRKTDSYPLTFLYQIYFYFSTITCVKIGTGILCIVSIIFFPECFFSFK